ncbi:MAG: PD40 domain-containing protein [Xanthomonadales bacterium]|nr:PD40 domain-containing protein [Xanthomonadales bacterium]
MTDTLYRIGEWTLRPEAHALSCGEVEHRVPKRLVSLLQVLADHAGQTLGRETLLDLVWQRRVVNDEVLSRAIAELRGLLGDDARAPRYIETLPKTGYRLIAEVSVVPAESPASTAVAEAGALPAHADPSPREGASTSITRVGDDVAARTGAPGRVGAGVIGGGAVALLLAVLAWWGWGRNQSRESVEPVETATTDWTPARMAREQPFRSGPDWARQPRFSRDGRWLTYVVGDVGSAERSVVLAAADGSASQRVDAGPGQVDSPVFSPDGTRMAVIARHEGGCVIRVLVLPAGAPRELTPCALGVGGSIEWSRDAGILFTAPPKAGRGAGVWAVDADSGKTTQRTDPDLEDIADTLPRARGDGSFAFLRGPFRLQKVWLWRPSGAEIAFDSADRITGMAWTADASSLLLATDRSGFPALHRFDLADGRSELLGGRGAATLDRAPDDSLIYEQRRYDANVWLYAPDAAPRRLTESTRYDSYPDLSADGRRLAYVSNRDGNGSVWVLDVHSGKEQRLALPDAVAWVRPGWFDDGHLVLTRYDAEHGTALYAFDLAANRLVDHAIARGAGFSSEVAGKHGLVFGLDHGAGAGMQLVLRDREGDQLLPGVRAVGEFRADGDRVAWQQRGHPGIRVRDLSAADADDSAAGDVWVPPHDDGSDYFAWTLVGDVIVYAHRDEAGWALWRRHLDGAAPHRWIDLLGAPADAQLSVAADMGAIVVSHIDAFHADLMRVPPR